MNILNREINYIKIFLKWFLKGIGKITFELLPTSIKKKIRSYFKREKDYDSFKGKI